MCPYQTAVARSSWLLFLNGDNIGSPMMRLATRLPAKMTVMEEAQHDTGCLRLNGIAPAEHTESALTRKSTTVSYSPPIFVTNRKRCENEIAIMKTTCERKFNRHRQTGNQRFIHQLDKLKWHNDRNIFGILLRIPIRALPMCTGMWHWNAISSFSAHLPPSPPSWPANTLRSAPSRSRGTSSTWWPGWPRPRRTPDPSWRPFRIRNPPNPNSLKTQHWMTDGPCIRPADAKLGVWTKRETYIWFSSLLPSLDLAKAYPPF